MSTALEVDISPRWTAIYRHPKYPKREVVLNCAERPAKEREFYVPMAGSVTFTAVSVTQLNEPKGGFQVAKAKAKAKRAKKKKKDEEEVEELEGLDDLDDEDEDDEDEPDVEDDDEEEEDEDDDEDDEDDEDEDDEEEEKPKKKRSKSKSKAKSKKGKKRGPTGPRELPKGKYSAQDIAEMAGTDARAVRLFLRKKENKKKYPKDKELGRYAFTKKDATRIAKALEKDED